MKGFVYISTNLINGKQYIGSHNYSRKKYFGSGILIKKALIKYGDKNFKREILIECNTIEEARELEEFYIKKYNTLNPNGYNISPSGGLTLYGCHSKETRKLIGDKLRGKKRNKEQKKLMSIKAQNRINPTNYKPFSELEAFTMIRLHLMMHQSAGAISNFLKIPKGRVERFLKNNKFYRPHPNGSMGKKYINSILEIQLNLK